jgi:hypothetical protein
VTLSPRVRGIANDGADFDDNLSLASARAELICRQRLARAVPPSQIILAAREAAADDRHGARCEVDLVGPGH